jgi:hypothetical protein
MYKYLVNNGIKVTQKIWHMKVPLKIKIFLWFLKKGVILTKTILLKEIRMVVRLVVFVAHLKLSDTCFFIVIILDFFSVLCLFYLVFILQRTRTIFSIVGQS